jgi:hypothetical protein
VKRYEPPAGWTVQAYKFALEPSDAQVAGVRGLSLDRDVNAARNLAGLVRPVDLELLGDAKTGRGAYVRPVRPAPAGGAAGREASRPVHPVNARPATDGCQS